MIYLTRTTLDTDGRPTFEIAACEDALRVPRYTERGYERCKRAAFIAAWQARDAQALEEMGDYVQAMLVERARAAGVPVGHWR